MSASTYASGNRPPQAPVPAAFPGRDNALASQIVLIHGADLAFSTKMHGTPAAGDRIRNLGGVAARD